MEGAILWGVISVIIFILLVIGILIRRKYPHPTDYYSFFWIGIIWIIVGIPMAFFGEGNYFFLIMGVAFAAIGLANRDKWKKNRVRWKNLKKPEKIIQRILIALFVLVIAVGIFLLIRLKGLM